ncbi:MAG: GNAT family N-acetyltransferase [Parvibaculum sp.]|nr:GNAT family N-acetyltransferase [Parvibaculum sp.]
MSMCEYDAFAPVEDPSPRETVRRRGQISEANQPTVSVRVVRSAEDLMRVVAIRAVVFMAEQKCPYEEEFDGNDYAGSTHLLAEMSGEPVATIRLRFFAGFGHVGRLAVMPQMRGFGTARTIVEEALRLCAEKGYGSLYAQAQKRLVPFWRQFGFEPMDRRAAPLVWSDHEYVEMCCQLAPRVAALDMKASDPLVLLRPEGAWAAPGILELSAARGATNPVG